jgi:hypothetical protein
LFCVVISCLLLNFSIVLALAERKHSVMTANQEDDDDDDDENVREAVILA